MLWLCFIADVLLRDDPWAAVSRIRPVLVRLAIPPALVAMWWLLALSILRNLWWSRHLLIVYQLTGVFGSVASDPDENPVPVAMTLIVA
jgi:hypothetical protein